MKMLLMRCSGPSQCRRNSLSLSSTFKSLKIIMKMRIKKSRRPTDKLLLMTMVTAMNKATLQIMNLSPMRIFQLGQTQKGTGNNP